MFPLFSCDKPRFSLKAGWRLSKALRRNFRSLQHAPLLRGSPWAQHSLGFAGGCNQQTRYTTFVYTYGHMYYTYIYIHMHICNIKLNNHLNKKLCIWQNNHGYLRPEMIDYRIGCSKGKNVPSHTHLKSGRSRLFLLRKCMPPFLSWCLGQNFPGDTTFSNEIMIRISLKPWDAKMRPCLCLSQGVLLCLELCKWMWRAECWFGCWVVGTLARLC